MQSWQLGSVGWGCTEPMVWTTLGTGSAEDVITGLEVLVDLPMWSLVDQQDERKKCWRKYQWKYLQQSICWSHQVNTAKSLLCLAFWLVDKKHWTNEMCGQSEKYFYSSWVSRMKEKKPTFQTGRVFMDVNAGYKYLKAMSNFKLNIKLCHYFD